MTAAYHHANNFECLQMLTNANKSLQMPANASEYLRMPATNSAVQTYGCAVQSFGRAVQVTWGQGQKV